MTTVDAEREAAARWNFDDRDAATNEPRGPRTPRNSPGKLCFVILLTRESVGIQPFISALLLPLVAELPAITKKGKPRCTADRCSCPAPRCCKIELGCRAPKVDIVNSAADRFPLGPLDGAPFFQWKAQHRPVAT